MIEESISTAWANWTTVIRNLIELPFLIFAFRYISKRVDERRELCNRVGVKYYSCMKIVKKQVSPVQISYGVHDNMWVCDSVSRVATEKQ